MSAASIDQAPPPTIRDNIGTFVETIATTMMTMSGIAASTGA